MGFKWTKVFTRLTAFVHMHTVCFLIIDVTH